jgi:phosphatidylinositol 3-kinase
MECLHNNTELNYKKKLCYQCHKLLFNITEISKFIKIFELLPLDIITIQKLFFVNRTWNKSIQFYLHNFKNIQYSTIYNNISLKTYRILNYNKFHICGHNKLITPYIIYNNWDKYKKTELIHILENLQIKKTKCNILLCNKHCSEKLTNYDILYILKYTKNKFIKEYLLEKFDISLISYFLPLFICYIKNDSLEDFSITNYLIDNCTSIKLLIELFFNMFIIINNIDNKNNNYIYKHSLQLIKNKLKIHNEKKYNAIINSIKLINLLSNISINNTDKYINSVNNFIKQNEVYIPLNNEKQLKNISKNIIIKDSNTKPIIIEIQFVDDTKKQILFKKEDVRVDYIISKIIKFIKYSLKHNNIFTNLLTYNILPINNSYGIIEIIENAHTLYDISEKLNTSLQNYILNQNQNETIDIIKRKFIHSLAIYSIITYILGIGDRHLDNIMVTRDGVLFHIDYSFCIGHDPKPFSPSIRITKDMIDMIGGINSENYKYFIENCNNYYNCIRKYTNVISLMIYLLYNINPIIFNEKSIKNHIIKKFIYSESDNYANSTLNDTIINCTDNYNYIDFFHYHSREKTVSKTVFNLYDSSLLLPSYLKNFVTSLL